ncbi:MAG: ROK family protein [Actinomycetia bacterium]|nr:ROK family protein [Actinomycetes bacterium]
MSGQPAYLALDIGGTKIAGGLIGSGGELLASAQVPTPPGGSAEELFEAVSFAVEAALSEVDITPLALGVGCGGPMKWPSGDVSPLNIPGWRDFPLRDELQRRFQLPVRIHNDAICLTIGEHLIGNGRGLANVMGMVVSTGVGGGVVSDGRLLNGASGNAGHIGHLVVDPAGPRCVCGGRGCLEAIARGPALVSWAIEQGWRSADQTGVALAKSARAGDVVAAAAFQRGGVAVGTAIASVAAVLDLDVVAIGGGISQAGDLFLPAVFEGFQQHAGLEFVSQCRILLAQEESALVGAAALFISGERYWAAAE